MLLSSTVQQPGRLVHTRSIYPSYKAPGVGPAAAERRPDQGAPDYCKLAHEDVPTTHTPYMLYISYVDRYALLHGRRQVSTMAFLGTCIGR